MADRPLLPRRLNLGHVLRRSPGEPDYVLPGLPVGAVGAVVGPGGTGKTYFVLQTALAVALGEPWFSGLFSQQVDGQFCTEPARVVLVLSEEPVDVVEGRVHAAFHHAFRLRHPGGGADQRQALIDILDENLHIYPLAGLQRILIDAGSAGEGDESEALGLDVLMAMAEGARLVILDPLRQFHSGDENSSWDMTALLQSLQRLAGQVECAVLLPHHTNKSAGGQGTGDRAGASRGSTAFTDGVRWQVNMSPLDESLARTYGVNSDQLREHVRLDLAKTNYLPPAAPVVLRRGAMGLFERLPLPDVEEPSAPPKRTVARRSPRK